MASKLTPLIRCAFRPVCRVARPQARAFSITATRPSDSLMVVSGHSRKLLKNLNARESAQLVLPVAVTVDWVSSELSIPDLPLMYKSDDAWNSTATPRITTPISLLSSTRRTRPSWPRSLSDILPSTRRPPSCPCSTSVSDSTASPVSAS